MKLVKEFALLLGSLVCAGSVLAEGAATDDEGVTSVGVTAITSENKNTIVAVSYGDLDGGAVSVSNLVKTTNLTEGDQLLVYNGSTFDSWVLAQDADDAPLYWNASGKTYTKDASGNDVEGTGTPATDEKLGVGTGLWLIRGDKWAGEEFTFYIYGSVASNPTSTTTTTPPTWTLVGNPTQSEKTITAAMTSGASNNDIIAVAEKYGFVNYIFKTKVGKTKVGKWVKETDFETEPSIDAGKGFWIWTKNEVTINWQIED